ncbi:MAG TPA: TatD family hydrolase [Ignavibacteriaceae bacterium]|nr:TatD family hydrolase [Ignavibacteriaceae bacterium]
MFIDTHAHLFYPNFADDIDEVIERAKSSGVDYIIVPATDVETAKQTLALADKYEMIYASVGVHPHDTKEWTNDNLKLIEDLAQHPKVVAIGEIGLDYYYDFSPKEKQIEAFKSQIELALKLNLPIVVHNRESDEDVLSITRNYCNDGLRAQFHCFNGSLSDAKDLIRMKFFISFTGNITFKKADSLREIISKIRLQHLMLETDSPFMTPVPFRGKRNEPSHVKLVAEKIAEIHKLSVEDVAKITSINAFRLFGIGTLPDTNFTYMLGKSLYVNITNRCNADCKFCRRRDDPIIEGYNLHMNKSEEPPAEKYIDEIGNPKRFNEIVFCGYGEPTIRWDVVKKIAKYVKQNGGRTRLDTNGHGSFINKRDITPELKGTIDIVSISLNASDATKYAEVMRVEKAMFNEMITFAKSAKQYVEKVAMSVVSIDETEIEKARQIVEEKIGAEFKIREYF